MKGHCCHLGKIQLTVSVLECLSDTTACPTDAYVSGIHSEMEVSTAGAAMSKVEGESRESSVTVVDREKTCSETGTICTESTSLNGTSERQQTAPTAVIAAPSDHGAQEFVLVRWMHPKMSVPLLVLAGDSDKAHVEGRGPLSDQLTLTGSRLQIDGQAMTSSTASFISLQQCPSQQPQLVRSPSGKHSDKVDGVGQSASKMVSVKTGVGKCPRGSKEKHPAGMTCIGQTVVCYMNFLPPVQNLNL